MRDFFKTIHDYPDEATVCALVIIAIIWMFFAYKIYKE